MADVNRGNRPMSPHLTIYRPQITSILSVFHRGTGVCLTAGGFLVALWFMAAAIGPNWFEVVDGLMTSWIGLLVLWGLSWCLIYHLLNGIRHLFWDVGMGFEIDNLEKSGIVVFVASGGGTVLLWAIALLW